MPLWLLRITALAVKELKVVLLDRRVLTTLIFSPVIQLLLFGFATTLEVRNIDLGVVNRDTGIASERLLAGFAGSPSFRELRRYSSEAALRDAIERREVIAGLVIPADLSQQVARRQTAAVGLVLDGRRINAAQIVAGYASEIVAATGAQLRPETAQLAPDVTMTAWYNPNLDYRWFALPGLVAVITTVLVLSVSVQALAREREFGTFDELMALPLHPLQIVLGKAVPAFSVGLANGLLFVLLIRGLSDVPFHGSMALTLAALACFSLAITGIGLAISTFAQNQQQAFLGGFLVIVPMILLSGYASPVDGMPYWLQAISRIDPLSHMLQVSHGMFLKGMTAAQAAPHIGRMFLIGTVALATATVLLKTRGE